MRTRVTTLLAVIGAATVLVLAGNTLALAATGKALIGGKVNVSKKATTIKRTKPGPALQLRTKSGAPFTVSNDTKVPLLNADKLDGRDASAFAAKGEAATKSETTVARRLLWFGRVDASGDLDPGAVLPGSLTKGATGTYDIDIPGFAPGCNRELPAYLFQAAGIGQARLTSASMSCGTGDYSATVITTNVSGIVTDRGFVFLALSRDTKPNFRLLTRTGRTPTTCEQRDGEVICR